MDVWRTPFDKNSGDQAKLYFFKYHYDYMLDFPHHSKLLFLIYSWRCSCRI